MMKIQNVIFVANFYAKDTITQYHYSIVCVEKQGTWNNPPTYLRNFLHILRILRHTVLTK